ncbi:MAG TPA: hypothetical protein VND65_10865 [Candidatus Binatia bacterium]|nr:hypothetical protein [Candidatus Binatia bacterium]
MKIAAPLALFLFFVLPIPLSAQTDCESGNGTLDPATPKTITAPEIIQKLGASETAAKQARAHYTYKQDVLVQTVSGANVTGEFHEVAIISYDSKGRRQEQVTFAAQPSLRGLQLTQDDIEDFRIFMPLMLATDDLAGYDLTYSGQQHVDDLNTYQFRVEPKKKDDKNKRYFEGRIWVDTQDFAIVKVCGKSGPERIAVKKRERSDLRPTFVSYRQQVDGKYWFPAYSRSDDTLHFKTGPVRLRETVKLTEYKQASGN